MLQSVRTATIYMFVLILFLFRALTIDATNPVFYCNRAAAYSKMGEFQKACEDCKMSLRYDPSYGKAYGRLGFAYSKLNRFDLAKESLQNACRLDPDNEDYKMNLSLTLQKIEEAKMQTGSHSTGAAAGSPNAPPDVQRLLQDLGQHMPELGNINGSTLMSIARVLLQDPDVQNIVMSMQPTTRDLLTET